MTTQDARLFAPATIAVATKLLAGGHWAEAERELRRLLVASPRDAAAWNLLSVIANGTQRAAEAVAHADRALALDARRAEFHFSRGRALKSLRRFDEAIAAYERALELRGDYAEARVSLGIVLRLAGRIDEAIAQYRRALEIRPDFPEALCNLGNALVERLALSVGASLTAEDLREAEAIQRRALALAPRNAEVPHNLAILLRLSGRGEEAAKFFDQALAMDSSRAESCLLLGETLRGEMQLALARGLYEKWLGDHPGEIRVVLALARCLHDLGEDEQALDWLARADAIEPGSAAARHLRGRIEQQTLVAHADAEDALALFAAAIDARPDYFEAVCSYLLTLCYSETDPLALREAHRARIAPVLAALPPVADAPRPVRRERPRIGFVSFDFKRHSVAYFLEALLERRDRARHEVIGYKTNANGDEVTARLQGLCDQWRDCATWSDAQIAQRCRDDGIDVLVDLSGLTSGARLGVFQRRAAACQLTWLGYPTTTGADCFDFRLTDAAIDPPGSESHGTEPPLRLPGSMFCYRPGAMPDVVAPPALRRGFVTFGSFNNFSKAGPRTLKLWCEVLRAVPGSRLRLKAGAFEKRGNRDHVVRHFVARGIAAERIEFIAWQPDPRKHFEAYGEIDIALDTFPFNGATTTAEALHMGVPVVSLTGATHPSRMGRSILGAAGLAHLATDDDAGYVALAADLASDVGRLAAQRQAQRGRMEASPLMDGAAFARGFQDAIDAALAAVSDAGARR